jgi:hypothetical protein
MDEDPPIVNQNMVANAAPHLHKAVEHLIRAWDAVHEAEKTLGFEITTMELSDLACGIDDPAHVRRDITESHILEWINDVRTSLK